MSRVSHSPSYFPAGSPSYSPDTGNRSGRAASSATTLLYDSFTDTNGTLLTAHTPDTNPSGNSWTANGTSMQIQGNAATANSTSSRGNDFDPLIPATGVSMVVEGYSVDTSDLLQFRFAATSNNNLQTIVQDGGAATATVDIKEFISPTLFARASGTNIPISASSDGIFMVYESDKTLTVYYGSGKNQSATYTCGTYYSDKITIISNGITTNSQIDDLLVTTETDINNL